MRFLVGSTPASSATMTSHGLTKSPEIRYFPELLISSLLQQLPREPAKAQPKV